MSVKIEQITENDQCEVEKIVADLWGDATLVVHGDVYHVANLQGLKAVRGDEIIGVLHYQFRGAECEILTLASLREGQGVGSALLAEVESLARSQNCRNLSLITTNDNLHALGFYQRRGYHLAALYPGQVDVSREIKPAIPLVADNHIPVRDELRLEKLLR